MSNAYAIAGVSAVLKGLIDSDYVRHDLSSVLGGGDVKVTAVLPDRITEGSDAINLFLYQVSENTGWKNSHLPSRNSRGERISNPPLAVDMHLLVSASGSKDLHAEVLLGHAIQVLHETPVLTRDSIRKTLSEVTPDPLKNALQASGLADQVEQIKLMPRSLSTEEISKLWGAFQTPYLPSASFKATVVLIQQEHSRRSALPVRARNFYVEPFKSPAILRIRSQIQEGDPILDRQPILISHRLVLTGENLSGEDTAVLIGSVEVKPDPEQVSDHQITVAIPDNVFAGVQSVQVIHKRLLGSPAVPHQGVESNIEAFVLSPSISARVANFSSADDGGVTLSSAELEVTFRPKVGKSQRVLLLLNEINPAPPPGWQSRAYSFAAPDRSVESEPEFRDQLTFVVNRVVSGSYLVRVQVDGAESPLEVDENGRYSSPSVNLS